MELQHRDTILVEHEGEEKEVYNWVNIERKQKASVRANSVDHFDEDPDIGAGDSQSPPEYVTTWLAAMLGHEFGIDVTLHDIEVVDIESAEVQLL